MSPPPSDLQNVQHANFRNYNGKGAVAAMRWQGETGRTVRLWTKVSEFRQADQGQIHCRDFRRKGGIFPFSGTSLSTLSDKLCSGRSVADENWRPMADAVSPCPV